MATALDKVKELKAQLAAAEQEASGEIAAAKKGIIGEILEHMKENDISLIELTTFARVGQSKYSHGTDTWSGKGKKPAWLEKAIAAGKKAEDFLTVKPQAAAAE